MMKIFNSSVAENSIMQTISIAVSAILIAAGLITAPSLINNARDTNAKQDLANIAMAQEYQLSDTGAYVSDVPTIVASASVKITLSSNPGVITGPGCYGAFARSGSGTYFYRTSASSSVQKVANPWPMTKPAGYPGSCAWPITAASVIPITNVAMNPNVNVSQPAVYNNNASSWTFTRGVAISGNPSGITVGGTSRVVTGVTTSAIMSLYNLDGLGNTSPTERQFGAWVYVSGSGYEVRFGNNSTPDTQPIPSSTWVFVTSNIPTPSNSWSQIQILKTDRSNVPDTDISYVTGIVATVGPTPIG